MAMEHLDSRSQELFAQYRVIAAKLKKRFMKKPNVREASEDYSKLANALKNEDNPQYAALCFSAMAKCDQLMGDSPGEAEAWANAGRQFLAAEDQLFIARHTTYWESLEAGIQCLLFAISVHERHNNSVLAAMYCLEIAHKLKYFKKFHEALRFFLRAADLQTQKPECQLQTLEEVVSCKIHLREYDSALGVLTKMVIAAKGKEGPYAVLRQRCEVSQLLLVLMLQIPRQYMRVEYSQLLEKYSKDLLEIDIQDSDVNIDLYILLQSMVIAVQDKNYKEMQSVRPALWEHLSPEQQHLLHLLMEAHCPYRQKLL